MLTNRALENDTALSGPGGRQDAAPENLAFVFVHGFQGWGRSPFYQHG